MTRARRAAVLATVAAGCCVVPGAALAGVPTGASIHASFLPDRLGASTAFTLAIRFSGGEGGVPAPLRGMVVHLPAGLGVDLRGSSICPRAHLHRRGASGCPRASLLGRGHAQLVVHAGSQAIGEEATVWIFRGPNRGGRATLEILDRGETPLDETTISTAAIERDLPPYGLRLIAAIPAIPTLIYEPDASFTSLSLTIGARGRPKAHAAAAITVPRRCPAGGFPFAADFTFGDSSSARATASVACP